MIETTRMRIVPFTACHLTPRYVSWLNNPVVTRYSDQRLRVHTLESSEAYRRSFEGTANGFWAVEAKDPTLGHIGNLATYTDLAHGLVDVGILMGERDCWGKGMGSEAWNAMCAHLLRRPDIRKVTASTLEVNTPMLALMRKAGMKEDGRRIRHCVWEGREVDVIYAALFRADQPVLKSA